MNEKYLKHTVENLIELANDLTSIYVDVTEEDCIKAIETLKTAEIMLDYYKNELFGLRERVDSLKSEIAQSLLYKMIDECTEKVTELSGVEF